MSNSNSFGQWLLVQWSEGVQSIINQRNLIINKECTLSVGDKVKVAGRRGIVKQATLLKISECRESLLNNMKIEMDTNHQIYNEPEVEQDFSGSSSSWRPEQTYISSDDDNEVDKVKNRKSIKKEYARRSYSRKGKKSQTPALRPTPIVPNHVPSQSTQKPTKDNGNMRKNKEFRNQTVQAMADSTRKASASPQIIVNTQLPQTNDSDMVMVSEQEIELFKKELEYLAQTIQNTKEIVKSLRSNETKHRPIDRLYETVYPSFIKTDNETHIKTDNETLNTQEDEEEDKYYNVYEFRSPSEETPCDNIKPLRYGVVKHNKGKKNSQSPSIENSFTLSTSNHTANNKRQSVEFRTNSNSSEDRTPSNHKMVPLGTGTTFVPKQVYDHINWSSYTIATRKLLMAVFPRRMLATHSLTGKASPAFMNKPAKLCLDPKKVYDIVLTVTTKCKVKDSLVRSAITTKCADENKMLRIRKLKERLNKAENKPLRNVSRDKEDEIAKK